MDQFQEHPHGGGPPKHEVVPEKVPIAPELREELSADWSRPVEIKVEGGELIFRDAKSLRPNPRGGGQTVTSHNTIECNCAHVPPTMPTCRDTHLLTCPVAQVFGPHAAVITSATLHRHPDLPPATRRYRERREQEAREVYEAWRAGLREEDRPPPFDALLRNDEAVS